jgi:1-aminocyclopropane-1-carboxylate deaminase
LHIKNVEISVDKIRNTFITEKGLELCMLRLDKIHPIISGNKLFKLHYFFEDLDATKKHTVITFGGAYSNHLVATAYYCHQHNIKCIGYVRGEESSTLSHSLLQCLAYHMQLIFLSRSDYAQINEPDFLYTISANINNCIIIPEGGYHPNGAKGAALINNYINNATHICTAIGTGTTIAGIIQTATINQQIIGVPVLKNLTDVEDRIEFLNGEKVPNNCHFFTNYHFGGYAKKTTELINFMNEFYAQHHIPTDFVYTAKMMYAVFDLIKTNHFAPGSKIMCIHTGGLQGNQSLPKNTLTF